MPIRIVIADDHPIVLDGLERVFGLTADVTVVARCTNGDQALDAVRHHHPDVLVLDVRMPGNHDLAVLRAMAAEALPTQVVLLTVELDLPTLRDAVQLGIRGAILKERAPQEIVDCVRRVHAGLRCLEEHDLGVDIDEARAAPLPSGDLTQREQEIIRLVAAGLRNKEIAARLALQPGTVKNHLYHVYNKLGVASRTELVRAAQSRGLL